MSEEGKEAFLDRWSRLKRQQPANAVPQPAVPEATSAAPPAPLPPVEQLKPDSDFAPFMAPKVEPALRRAALKKLFGDAHFNVPDAFEPYSADFTQGEPIPQKMLQAINEARDAALRKPDENIAGEKPAETVAREPDARAHDAAAPEGEAKDVAGRQDA